MRDPVIFSVLVILVWRIIPPLFTFEFWLVGSRMHLNSVLLCSMEPLSISDPSVCEVSGLSEMTQEIQVLVSKFEKSFLKNRSARPTEDIACRCLMASLLNTTAQAPRLSAVLPPLQIISNWPENWCYFFLIWKLSSFLFHLYFLFVGVFGTTRWSQCTILAALNKFCQVLLSLLSYSL